MCLSIPSKVVEITDDKTSCVVDTMGVKREASLLMMIDQDIEIGDYVLLHIGFVMNKIDDAEALSSIEIYQEMLDTLTEDERKKVVLEDDECPNRSI